MKYKLKRHSVVQPRDQSIRLIPLTRGQNAIVDAADYEWLMQWNWNAQFDPTSDSFYAARKIKVGGKEVRRFIHQEILGLDIHDKREGDHIDGRTLDNRRGNLRIALHGQNHLNHRRQRNNTCGFKGVCRERKTGMWRARISIGKKRMYLGAYRDPSTAYAVYCEAARKYHGEFARLA